MFSKFEALLLLGVVGCVLSASVAKDSADMSSEMSVLSKVYDECESREDFAACLKAKAATAISRAVEQVRKCSINRSKVHLRLQNFAQ